MSTAVKARVVISRTNGTDSHAVLEMSAVEARQRRRGYSCARCNERLRVPTLLFLNKIDRAGADDERMLRAIADRLTDGHRFPHARRGRRRLRTTMATLSSTT